MKTDIKRLAILRDSLISQREHKIFLLEEGNLTNEEKIILSDEINKLTEKILRIDEKLPKDKT